MKQARAQWVTLPDTAFATALQLYLNTSLSGNQLDTSSSEVQNLYSLAFPSATNIHDFTGIRYFHSLHVFSCFQSQATALPTLPSSLRSLDFESGLLTSLPILPDSLEELNCSQNLLTALPALPPGLIRLECGQNLLTGLPPLPSGIWYLNVEGNQLSALPPLPPSLKFLYCSLNQLSTMPALPNRIRELYCDRNLLGSIPNIPDTLRELSCSQNNLGVLPALDDSLQVLACDHNLLTTLPAVPPSMQQLNCSYNHLVSIPLLPNSVLYLECRNNQLSSITNLPDSLAYLDCGVNPMTCLPPLHAIHSFVFDSLPALQCLPNYPAGCAWSVPSFSAYPLCDVSSGCPIGWKIAGNVHVDSSSGCQADSLFPGTMSQQVKLMLYHNGSPLQQFYTYSNGLYSFNTSVPDSVEVTVDTSGKPFYVACPAGGSRTEVISPSDSLHQSQDFGIQCLGSDLGVQSIESQFCIHYPTREVNIAAGDLSQLYHLHCGASESGTVTITINGPVTYLYPAPGALNPTSWNGNVLTYNVPDFGAIDLLHAFHFIAHTDTLAPIGSLVCITVSVHGNAPDLFPADDSLTFCSSISIAFDPNEKDVYPSGGILAGDWLTYTLHFQNTGTDTASRIVVRDTLNTNLDLPSFEFLASSHSCITQLSGAAVSFVFPHINLPDSLTNEPLSHGWVQFRIRSMKNLGSGTNIRNRASIYFENNPPVATNVTNNVIDIPASVPETPASPGLQILPNPVLTTVQLWFSEEGEKQICCYDALGRMVQEWKCRARHLEIDTHSLPPGLYFVTLRSSKGISMGKFLKVE